MLLLLLTLIIELIALLDGGAVFPLLAFNPAKVCPHFLNCEQIPNTRDKSRTLSRELGISARGINKTQQFLRDEIINASISSSPP